MFGGTSSNKYTSSTGKQITFDKMDITKLHSLPLELLLRVLLYSKAPELIALRNASAYLRDTIDTQLEYLLPRIIERYYEDEDKLLTKIMIDTDPNNTDGLLKVAVACVLELDLLNRGELDVGILQRYLLPPSARSKLGTLATRFSPLPGKIVPCNSEFVFSTASSMRDIAVVGVSSYRRAASNPLHVQAWMQAYTRIANRHSLDYLSFLDHFHTLVDHAVTRALPYEGHLRDPEPEYLHSLRRFIMWVFIGDA